MAVLVNKSAFDALCTSLSSNLSEEINNTNNSINSINSFADGIQSGYLKGDMWKTIASKYELYSSAMTKRKEVAENYKNTVDSAKVQIDGAWDPRFGNEIEDSKLAEVEREILNVKAQIRELYAALAMLDESDPAAAVAIAELKLRIKEAEDILAELEDLLEAIKRFLAVYETVCGEVTSASDLINSSFVSYVSGIQPSVL